MRALERLGQGPAVGQAGQRVVQGQVRQADLGLLARGDVGRDADDLQRPAVGPALGHLRMLLDPGIAAVPAAHAELDPGLAAVAAAALREHGADPAAVARVDEVQHLGQRPVLGAAGPGPAATGTSAS